MTRISLLTATVSNSGAFVDGGSELTVGDDADQINSVRAGQLVDLGWAIDPDASEDSSSKSSKTSK